MLFFIDWTNVLKLYTFHDFGFQKFEHFDTSVHSHLWQCCPTTDQGKYIDSIFNSQNWNLPWKSLLLYSFETDEMLEIRKKTPKFTVSFSENLKSFPMKRSGSHTLDHWCNNTTVVIGDNEDFVGRVYWTIDDRSVQDHEDSNDAKVSLIYLEDTCFFHGYTPEKEHFMLKLLFDSRDGKDMEDKTKEFNISRIHVCKRSYTINVN